MHRSGFVESPACDCGAEEQTMRYLVDDCPLRLFVDGLTGLCAMSDETVEYLSGLGLDFKILVEISLKNTKIFSV
jgi:hypothetical protein